MDNETTLQPPCHQCVARCCRQQTSGWPFAAALEPDEENLFAEFAVHDVGVQAMVLPYNERGDCPYLGQDNHCRIHPHTPKTCRDFNCTTGHIIFLTRNPELLVLLETLEPHNS